MAQDVALRDAAHLQHEAALRAQLQPIGKHMVVLGERLVHHQLNFGDRNEIGKAGFAPAECLHCHCRHHYFKPKERTGSGRCVPGIPRT
ncbi:hypothetical protein D3C72_1960110 [compost metagenome]